MSRKQESMNNTILPFQDLGFQSGRMQFIPAYRAQISTQAGPSLNSLSSRHFFSVLEIRKAVKMEQSSTQCDRCAITKWPRNEIFDTMTGAAHQNAIASSSNAANQISEETIELSILKTLTNYMPTTLCFRAHESHVVQGFDTRSFSMHFFSATSLLSLRSFGAAASELALCC